jgi:hypothetical protein
MSPYRDRRRVVAAALLVAGTVLVVVGASLERSQTTTDWHQQAATVQRPADEAGEPSAGEAGDHSEAAEQAQGGEPSGQAEGGSGEELLGVNLESVGLTVAAVVVSLLLAVLDVRESVHQASEARPGLLALALLAGVGHLVAAWLAAAGLRAPSRVATAP